MTNYSGVMPMTSDRLSNFDRVKVDPAQTSFFEGKEFRTFKDVSIAASATYVVKVVVPINTILAGLDFGITSGEVRLATVSGGTPAGTYAEVLPIFARNAMSVGPSRRANYLPTVVLTAGGTHTGGTEIDIIRLKAGSNQGNSGSQSVGGSAGDERGIAPGTYHFRFVAAAGDPVVGVFRMRWEERP